MALAGPRDLPRLGGLLLLLSGFPRPVSDSAERINPRRSVVRKTKARAMKPSSAVQTAIATCWPTE